MSTAGPCPARPLREEPCPTQGARWAPNHWAKAFTRLHFWVWKHDMVLVPRGGSSLVRMSSFIMIKHTHGGNESSNRSVSSVICTAFNLGQVPLGPCSVTAARDGNFACSEYIFGAFRGAVFCPPNMGPVFGPSTCGRKGFLLVGSSWCHFGGPFSAPHLLQTFQFRNPMLGSVNAAASRSCHDGLFLKSVMLLYAVSKSSSTFLGGLKTASTNPGGPEQRHQTD